MNSHPLLNKIKDLATALSEIKDIDIDLERAKEIANDALLNLDVSYRDLLIDKAMEEEQKILDRIRKCKKTTYLGGHIRLKENKDRGSTNGAFIR